MKKVVGLLLILTLVVSLYGCSKGSGLTIDALQQVFVKMDDDIAFEKTKKEKGCSFRYKNDSGITPIEYSGEADAKENITTIKITNSNVKVSKLKDEYELKKAISKSGEEMSISDLGVVKCYLEVVHLREAFGADDSDTSPQEIVDFFTKGNSTMSVGDWTIKADIEGENTVVISASYSA